MRYEMRAHSDGLTRIIHDGSSRKRGAVRTRCVLVQYVEGPRGSPLAEGLS